ncbi:MAG TPA: hypothetical protein VGE01_00740 [Fimbriimonas sp.]
MFRSRLLLLLAAALTAACGCQPGVDQKANAFEVPPELDDGAVIVSLFAPENA